MEHDALLHYGIKGMKWGVRRYQNKDGSLTPKGEARYDRDKRENAAKKKENRIDLSQPDPKRWAKEDLERTKRTVDASANLAKELKKLDESTTSKPTPKRMDLSKMSDKEMRDQINRELLERQYNQLFAECLPLRSPRAAKRSRPRWKLPAAFWPLAAAHWASRWPSRN